MTFYWDERYVLSSLLQGEPQTVKNLYSWNLEVSQATLLVEYRHR